MTTAEKCDMVYQAVVKRKLIKDIAKENRVTPNTVNMLVANATRKPNYISELYAKDDDKQEKFERVEAMVKDMAKNHEFIDSCETVMEKFKENEVQKVHPSFIRKVMLDIGFKYKKVNQIALSANSERSMVLR